MPNWDLRRSFCLFCPLYQNVIKVENVSKASSFYATHRAMKTMGTYNRNVFEELFLLVLYSFGMRNYATSIKCGSRIYF